MQRGIVHLVGAGPGDPGLITARGAAVLARADFVAYDYLVDSRLLQYAPASVETLCVGRQAKGHGRVMSVGDVTRRMIDAARRGMTVVRLKSGDPMLFARAAEEIAALRAVGIAIEITPGVTAASAAASYSETPLTDRDAASAVAFLTGRRRADGVVSWDDLDYAALARFPGTLVVYMGVKTVDVWSRGLIDHGMSRDTPVLAVRRCTFADQSTHACRLGDVADWVKNTNVEPPAVFMVGEVTRDAMETSWFTRRALHGKRVLVTRPDASCSAPDVACVRGASSAGGLERLSELGPELLYQPAITIDPPGDWAPVDRAIENVAQYDWIVFTSVHGVRYFFERLRALGRDVRALVGARLAAIGPATSAALDAAGARADVVPDEYCSESLADALLTDAKGKRFLLARSNRGRPVLAARLQSAGGVVETIEVYTSRDVTTPDARIMKMLDAGEIDWTTVTSTAIARSLVAMFGAALRKTRLAAISGVTADALRELGYPASVVAESFTIDGVVAAIEMAERAAEDTAR